MAENNIENQTLDKIENSGSSAKKHKKTPKIRLNFDLIIVLILVSVTLAMIIWWYLEISKV